MDISPVVLWLGSGVIMFLAEMGLPGIGLMFAGCGALTVGMLMNFGIITAENVLLQALIFVISTAIWTVILWKPIQKLKLGKSKTDYSNIIGETAIVSEKGISKINGGEVMWSGTVMKAKLDKNSSVEKLDSGAVVVIKDINGNVLTVSAK